jgi:hypothetical protein
MNIFSEHKNLGCIRCGWALDEVTKQCTNPECHYPNRTQDYITSILASESNSEVVIEIEE